MMAWLVKLEESDESFRDDWGPMRPGQRFNVPLYCSDICKKFNISTDVAVEDRKSASDGAEEDEGKALALRTAKKANLDDPAARARPARHAAREGGAREGAAAPHGPARERDRGGAARGPPAYHHAAARKREERNERRLGGVQRPRERQR